MASPPGGWRCSAGERGILAALLRVAPPPRLGGLAPRLQSSGSASSLGSSAPSERSDSSAVFQQLDMLLQPGGGQHDKPSVMSDGEGSDPAAVGDRAWPHKRARNCKSKRARYKRYVAYAEKCIVQNPDIDLEHLRIPPFISRDERTLKTMWKRLEAYQADVRGEQLTASGE
mmetsp:Transcript_107424/g.334869  ORF Transcript_107424/g.334869 Transcript_107424/m.334869 type:complete len:172 (+) Transcript_107424:64-579(+)